MKRNVKIAIDDDVNISLTQSLKNQSHCAIKNFYISIGSSVDSDNDHPTIKNFNSREFTDPLNTEARYIISLNITYIRF